MSMSEGWNSSYSIRQFSDSSSYVEVTRTSAVTSMTAKDVWKIQDLLDIIKSEVEAMEISEAIRTTDLKPLNTHRRPLPQQHLPC